VNASKVKFVYNPNRIEAKTNGLEKYFDHNTASIKRKKVQSKLHPHSIRSPIKNVDPKALRYLSLKEYLLALGFPKKWIVKGTLTQRSQQFANSVPVPLSQAIAKSIKLNLTKRFGLTVV